MDGFYSRYHNKNLFNCDKTLTIFLQSRNSNLKNYHFIFAGCRYSTSVQLHNLFCNSKSQSCTTVLSSSCCIKSSNLSAFSSDIERYFVRSSSDIWLSSRSSVRYPTTEVRGVFKSWAKYTTKSFFLCSASFASC